MKFTDFLKNQAPLAFVLAALVLIWATGNLHFGAGEEHAEEVAAAPDAHAGHGHAPGAHPDDEAAPAAPDPHAGHGHAPGAHPGEEAAPAAAPDPHAGHNHAPGAHPGEEDEAEEWCAEHGVPEDACTICNPALIAAFKAKGDWCAGHNLPESVCPACNPVAEHTEAAPDPHAGHNHAPGAHPGEEDEAEEWCAEHGVPEDACTICNPALIAAFKAKGDWCAGHNLPESVCPPCNPVVDGSFASLEKPRCEHAMPMVKCDNCRFELGVVKVDPSLDASLLTRGLVTEQEALLPLRLTGQVTLDRNLVVEVPTTAAGRVLTVEAGLGDMVEKGDLLAIIHSGEFGAAKAKWLETLTNCEVAKSERDRQNKITTALTALVKSLGQEGSGANGEGEMLQLPVGAVGEWKSKLVSAAARLKVARLTHAREKALEEKGISAASEHEVAHHAYEAARAEYAALLEEVKLSLDLDKLKSDNSFRQACAAVMVSEQRLRIFGLGDDELSRLRDIEPGEDFARLEIRAPRSGRITAFDLSAGHLVEADTLLFTIADLSSLWVWCDVYERDLGLVADAMAEHMTLDAEVRVNSQPGQVHIGVLDVIGSEMDVHTRTVKVRLLVDNEDGRLRPGMFADVTVGIPLSGHALVVPRNAVLTDEGDSFVFQYWKDNLWVRRDVTVVRTLGDRIQIEGGIKEGAVVATGGAFMLKSDVLREKMGAG